MESLLVQLRQALRRLRHSPDFTLICLLALSLGIASSTLVFSAVNGILLNPLPYPQAERLVGLWHRAPGLGLSDINQSEATYRFYQREGRDLFEGVGAYTDGTVNLTGGESPRRLAAAWVTPSLLAVLGVSPSQGRALSEEEGRPGSAAVVLLSHRLWRERFGAGQQVVGEVVRIDGVPHQVIGVMPPDFRFPQPETDLWIPLRMAAAAPPLGRFSLFAIGRLSSGLTPRDAEVRINQKLSNLLAVFPGDEAAPVLQQGGFAAEVRPLREDLVGDVSRILWILFGAVGLVLLIACANVANLLLVRNEGLRRERAVRTALGATRLGLMRAALIESLLLGLGAGAVGALLAALGLRLLVRLGPASLPRLQEIAMDGRVLGFTVAVSVLSSVLFGAIPTLLLREGDLGGALKGTGQAARLGRPQRHTQKLLVALQIALAQVVLIAAGLLLQSFLRLAERDPGFEPEGLLTFQISLPAADYPDEGAVSRLYLEVLERIAAVGGVQAVGATSLLPLGGTAEASGQIIEGQEAGPQAVPPIVDSEYVSQGYFEAMGIPLRQGRFLERGDIERRTGAVVVNEAFARHYWPDGGAVGKRIHPASVEGDDPWYTVVGVVGNVRNRGLREDAREILYYPMVPKAQGAWLPRQMSLVVRSAVPAESLTGAITSEIWAVDRNLPIAAVKTGGQLLAGARQRLTFSTVMFALATLVALVLAAVGVYGFVAYVVSRRIPEIGVRMAMGASRGDIRRMFLKEGVGIAVLGIGVGVVASLYLTRVLGTLLFEVSPLDPGTFASVPVLLLLLVLVACYLPADRATQVDPLTALGDSAGG